MVDTFVDGDVLGDAFNRGELDDRETGVNDERLDLVVR